MNGMAISRVIRPASNSNPPMISRQPIKSVVICGKGMPDVASHGSQEQRE
jgi:hypothetical protein